MRYLEAGTTPPISKIGLGTWQFGSPDWGYGAGYAGKEARAIVRRALDLGVTLFDTAEIYSSGDSERILGEALGDQHDRAFLATKILPMVPTSRAVAHRARASACRLRAQRLDLYQVHQRNPLISENAVMRGMRAAQHAGLIGEVGVSNYSLRQWRAAESALGGRVLSNQVRYSLADRSAEAELLPFALEHRRVVIAYSPLAQGLLSARYTQEHPPPGRLRSGSLLLRPENRDSFSALLATLREVAHAHDATPAQVALAWVIHRAPVVAIPGAATVEQMENNAAAADITLAADEYRALQAASDPLRPPAGHPPGRLRHLRAARQLAMSGKHLAQTAWRDHRR
jgi:aryl-alcohol dehydrogenase-like predicted oxidoreductase